MLSVAPVSVGLAPAEEEDWGEVGRWRPDDGNRPMSIVLLAQRLRVEERQLIAAFAERGHDATLSDPARLACRAQTRRIG